MLIYGFHPVREALRSRAREVREVLVAANRRGKRRRDIETLCGRASVACRAVPEAELERLAPGVHNGFVALLAGEGALEGGNEAATVREPAAGRAGDPDLAVLVEDIQDPRNLGALLRVCEGAGVGRVLVRDRGTAPLSATVVKTSAGAAEWLEVERVPNSSAAIERFKKAGFWIYGADPSGRPPWELDLKGPVLLCLGGEEKGLRRLTRRSCDFLVGLPMRGRVESLNVATAAAALLYEALRQRTEPPDRQ